MEIPNKKCHKKTAGEKRAVTLRIRKKQKELGRELTGAEKAGILNNYRHRFVHAEKERLENIKLKEKEQKIKSAGKYNDVVVDVSLELNKEIIRNNIVEYFKGMGNNYPQGLIPTLCAHFALEKKLLQLKYVKSNLKFKGFNRPAIGYRKGDFLQQTKGSDFFSVLKKQNLTILKDSILNGSFVSNRIIIADFGSELECAETNQFAGIFADYCGTFSTFWQSDVLPIFRRKMVKKGGLVFLTFAERDKNIKKEDYFIANKYKTVEQCVINEIKKELGNNFEIVPIEKDGIKHEMLRYSDGIGKKGARMFAMLVKAIK